MSKHFNEAVEGDDGGLVICRGCKARGTYAALPSGECPTPYKPNSVLLKESLAREQALQQRLTAADERADVLETENKRLDLMVSQADYNYDADRMQFKARIDELEGLLRDINDAPGGSRFKKHIDATLKPAEGDRDDA